MLPGLYIKGSDLGLACAVHTHCYTSQCSWHTPCPEGWALQSLCKSRGRPIAEAASKSKRSALALTHLHHRYPSPVRIRAHPLHPFPP